MTSYYPKSEDAKKLKTMVRNIFSGTNTDWKSGWNRVGKDEKDMTELICEKLPVISCKQSRLFSDRDNGGLENAVDILCGLIILPIQPQSKYTNSVIASAFKPFVSEFAKIESQFSRTSDKLRVVKKVVDLAIQVRSDFMSGEEKEAQALATFKTELMKYLDSVAKFCMVRDMDYELMLASCITIGLAFENVICCELKKEKVFEMKTPFTSHSLILTCLNCNFTDDDVPFTKKSKVRVYDSQTQTQYALSLSTLSDDDITAINECHASTKADLIVSLTASSF